MKRVGKVLGVLFVLCMCVFVGGNVSQAKVVKKTVVVLKGASKNINLSGGPFKKKVSNKNVKVKEDKEALTLTVTGKKVGTSKITVTYSKKSKAQYTVKVLSQSKVKKTSDGKLKKYVKKLKKKTQYAYVDINNDGVKEVFHHGGFTYYNYITKKLVTKKYGIKTLYVSQESDKIFAMLQDDKVRNEEEFVYFSAFYELDLTKVLDLKDPNTGYRRYTDAGKKAYGVTKDYSFYDYLYDQDDYEYEAYTQEELAERLKTEMPKIKEVKMKTR